jgi:hypothetical protein
VRCQVGDYFKQRGPIPLPKPRPAKRDRDAAGDYWAQRHKQQRHKSSPSRRSGGGGGGKKSSGGGGGGGGGGRGLSPDLSAVLQVWAASPPAEREREREELGWLTGGRGCCRCALPLPLCRERERERERERNWVGSREGGAAAGVGCLSPCRERERERGAGLAHGRAGLLQVWASSPPVQRERERERERNWVGSREGGAAAVRRGGGGGGGRRRRQGRDPRQGLRQPVVAGRRLDVPQRALLAQPQPQVAAGGPLMRCRGTRRVKCS